MHRLGKLPYLHLFQRAITAIAKCRSLPYLFRFASLCRAGDEIHLIHVIPRKQLESTLGAPPVDSLPQQSPSTQETTVNSVYHFIKSRFTAKLDDKKAKSVIHVVKVSLNDPELNIGVAGSTLEWAKWMHKIS